MYTDIIKEFKLIQEKLQSVEVMLDPWPHLVLENVFTDEFYKRIIQTETNKELMLYLKEHGRIERIWDSDKIPQLRREYDIETNNIFQILSKKFNKDFGNVKVPCTTTFWEDSNGLEIIDIHVDAFFDTDFTISGQVYLPTDTQHEHLGTSLYRYIGQDLYSDAVQDPGTQFPHTVRHENEHKFELVKEIPYLPNSMFITTNEPNSWHQAPVCIDPGYIRKSLMFRWKV